MRYLLLVAVCCIGWWLADIFLPLPLGGLALTLGSASGLLWGFIKLLGRGNKKEPSWIDELERKAGVPEESIKG
tara:strand:+ start:1167 stop:1388 length:222 start_codon:yes stop_codon:yes gene_type:complete